LELAGLDWPEAANSLTTGPAPLLGVHLVSTMPDTGSTAGPAAPSAAAPGLPGVLPATHLADPKVSPQGVDLFSALADTPTGPASAGPFTGGPDAVRVGRLDVPGLNPQLAYSMMVLSVQTLSGVGGTDLSVLPELPQATAPVVSSGLVQV